MPQEIDVRKTAAAAPATVWALLDDSTTWPDWTPIETCEIERPGSVGVNEIRKFKTGRVTVREEIVERDEGRRLSYVLLEGLAVRDYRAEIDLTGADGATEIRWHTTFDAKVPGSGWVYRRAIQTATAKFLDGLCEAAAAGG